TLVGNSLYFVADSTPSDDGPTGFNDGLWATDGTTLSTTLVDDDFGGQIAFPFDLTAVNGDLYFVGSSGDFSHFGLWKYSTADGTTVLLDNLPPQTVPGGLVNVNGRLFFTFANGPNQ